MIDTKPCCGCTERYPGCHDRCMRHHMARAAIRARQRPSIRIGSPEDAIRGYLAQKRK